MKAALHCLGLFALVAVATESAYSAQDAMITAEQAAIRERPAMDAKIIESKPAGARIRLSKAAKNGWFKTRASTGQFGWIWQADVAIQAFDADFKAANVELREKPRNRRSYGNGPWFFLRAGGGLMALLSGDVSSRLGAGKNHIYLSPLGFGELAIRVDEVLRVALRVGAITSSHTITYNSVDYNLSFGSTPVLLGLDADVYQGMRWEMSAGVYAGIGFNSFSATAPGLPAPNATSIKGTSYAVLLNFAAKYWVLDWLAVVGEFGIYGTQIPKITVPNSFNGDTPFRNATGGLGVIHVNELGPLATVAAQFAL